LSFELDRAEELSTVEDSIIDIIMLVGAFEHMPKKYDVLSKGSRALKPGGKIVILTPHGDYLWYRFIAPVLRIDTKHLSTDTFLNGGDVEKLLRFAGFIDVSIGYWTFIPKGDMNPVFSTALRMFDRIGKFFKIAGLRGGLVVTAQKPFSQ
jgi:ubiquinone/menaquinone biosynthesis C-methylase UbiE